MDRIRETNRQREQEAQRNLEEARKQAAAENERARAEARRSAAEETRREREQARIRMEAEAEHHAFQLARREFERSWQAHRLHSGIMMNMWDLEGFKWIEVDSPARFGIQLGNSREIVFRPGRHMIDLRGATTLRLQSKSGSEVVVRTRAVNEHQMQHFIQN